MPGEVSAVAFRDGERFKAGDVLVEYDCALPKARLLRAEAAASAAEGRWRSARELRKLNSISTADYEEARANVGIAAAEAKAERIQVGRCSIKAPFSGMVGETYVRPHEYVGEGQKLLTIYEVSAFEVEAILPGGGIESAADREPPDAYAGRYRCGLSGHRVAHRRECGSGQSVGEGDGRAPASQKGEGCG